MSTLAEIESAVESLPLAEQEELLNRLVVKLGGGTTECVVREDHMQLLDERFAAYRQDPGQASTWEEVKRRLQPAAADADRVAAGRGGRPARSLRQT